MLFFISLAFFTITFSTKFDFHFRIMYFSYHCDKSSFSVAGVIYLGQFCRKHTLVRLSDDVAPDFFCKVVQSAFAGVHPIVQTFLLDVFCLYRTTLGETRVRRVEFRNFIFSIRRTTTNFQSVPKSIYLVQMSQKRLFLPARKNVCVPLFQECSKLQQYSPKESFQSVQDRESFVQVEIAECRLNG